MARIPARSSAKSVDAYSFGEIVSAVVTEGLAKKTVLRRYGTRATSRSRTELTIVTVGVSTGRTDMMLV